MSFKLSVALLTLWMSLRVSAATITFYHNGKSVILDDQFRKKLVAEEVTVVDPVLSPEKETKSQTYIAYPGQKVLDEAFGGRKNWATSKFIKVKCLDGYEVMLEAKYFVAGGFYFAHAIKGIKKFEIKSGTVPGKIIGLQPYYLIWKTAELQSNERGHYWPYQISQISLEK